MYGPEFAADPGRVYSYLRRWGPLAPVELAPGVPATLVVGYDAALQVLRDPATFVKDAREWQKGVPADCPVLPMMMYRPNCRNTDGEVHARLRAAVTDSLARIDLNALRGHVERTADTLISGFRGRGAADLVTEYARALPLMVFNELFGCPPDIGDRLVEGMSGIFDTVDAKKANQVLRQAVRDLVALKRREPGADMTSWLMAHPVRLTDEEVMHQVVTLQGAGTEPEQNLIANGLRLLLSDDRFAGDLSGGSLPVEDALDEVLWTDPPLANFAITYPVRDVDFAGVLLPRNQPVVISLAGANTDPSLASDQRVGNRAHLAWSAGPHICPAQGQARLIATVAIEQLLDALPDMELAVPADRLVWRPGPFHRALTGLPVSFPAVSVPEGALVPSAGTAGAVDGRESTGPAVPVAPLVRATARATHVAASDAPRGPWNSLVKWWHGE
ncbi:cytochrome P450 [Actinomadura alba]|uniref:Cytochrome P450 n=1 Tax=Actinomadura alba TaxID=406431 RepID=A0ABR7LXF0_9ACTN|nr:cytochrome P450 [Actinomadura alba]